LETVQEHKISILLARETFDPKIAPLRAWVAQMELDGMKERMTMGVKARLKAGKANTGQDRDGYRRVGETIEIVEEEEARWIKLIFEVLCYFIHFILYLAARPACEIYTRVPDMYHAGGDWDGNLIFTIGD